MTAQLTDIISPDGWSAGWSAGDSQIVWTADSEASALRPDQAATFGFTPDGVPGGSQFTFTARSQTSQSVIQHSSFAGGPVVRTGPAIDDIGYSVTEDEVLTVDAASGLLANDLFEEGSNPQVTAGTVISFWDIPVLLNADGSFTYDAAHENLQGLQSESGPAYDSFEYRAESGSESGTATVIIRVGGRNDAPVAVDDTGLDGGQVRSEFFIRGAATTQISAEQLLANDTDADVGDVLEFAEVDTESEFGAAVSFDAEQQHVIYDATSVDVFRSIAPGRTILDTFEYRIRDRAGEEAVGTVVIEVYSTQNLSPIAGDDVFQVFEDSVLTVPSRSGLLSNDSDPDSLPGQNTLFAVGDASSDLGASVSVQSTGRFTYDPTGLDAVSRLAAGETLQDTFRYTLFDGAGGADIGTVRISIIGTNDPPAAEPDTYSGAIEDETFTITADRGVLLNDSDPDGIDDLIVDLSRSASTSQMGARISMRADGSFDYIPTADLDRLPEGEPAQDSFTYTVVDTAGAFAFAEVSIGITGVNDGPVAGDDNLNAGYSTPSRTPFTAEKEIGVLRNDIDPDEGETTELVVTTTTVTSEKGATVTFNEDGSFTYDPRGSAELDLAADEDEDVIDTFEYEIRDLAGLTDTATVSIVVKAEFSQYVFDTVASTRDEAYEDLGRGPSINNHGVVAFRGSLKTSPTHLYYPDKLYDNLFTLDLQAGDADATPLMHEILALPRVEGFPLDNPPTQRFGDYVDINDRSQVLAWRNLNAVVYIGAIFGVLPIGDTHTIPLSYLERWRAGETALPEPVAMGDAVTMAAGIRLGDPFFRDMQLSAIASVASPSFGLAFGATMGVRMWFLNPVWGQTWPSLFDQTGDFSIVYGNPAINNRSLTAFPAQTGVGGNQELFLVTAPHPGQISRIGAGTPDFIAEPDIADNGRVVAASKIPQGDETLHRIYSLPYNLDPAGWKVIAEPGTNGFLNLGPNPAISDDGSLMVFTGHHESLGKGIFVADPISGRWSKVAGESLDGVLDAGESHADFDFDGVVDAGEDFGDFGKLFFTDGSVDTHLGINRIGDSDRYQIAFMGEVISGTKDDNRSRLGLQTIEIDLSENFPLNDVEALLQHRIVAGVGHVIPGVGKVTRVHLYDPIDTSGRLAFWVDTESDGEAIVAASLGDEIGIHFDTDNDGHINTRPSRNNEDERRKRTSPGGLVVLNNDDDNNDGTIDLEQGQIADDDELFEVRLTVFENVRQDEGQVLTLRVPEGHESIKFWSSDQKSREMAIEELTWQLDHAQPPESIWIEGIALGRAKLELELSKTDGSETEILKTQTANLTVMDVDVSLPEEVSVDQIKAVAALALASDAPEDVESRLKGLQARFHVFIDGVDANRGTRKDVSDGGAAAAIALPMEPGQTFHVELELSNKVRRRSNTMKIVPGAPASVELELSEEEGYVSDGNDTITITATFKDQFGNIVADGTDVDYLISNSTGPFGTEFAEVDSSTTDGKAQVTVRAPSVPISQVLRVTSGNASETIPIPVTSTTASLVGPAELDIASGDSGTLVLSTNASNGTPVTWVVTNGNRGRRVIETTVSGGQAILDVSASGDWARVGPSFVTAAVGNAFATHVINYVNSNPFYIELERFILAGDRTEDADFVVINDIEAIPHWTIELSEAAAELLDIEAIENAILANGDFDILVERIDDRTYTIELLNGTGDSVSADDIETAIEAVEGIDEASDDVIVARTHEPTVVSRAVPIPVVARTKAMIHGEPGQQFQVSLNFSTSAQLARLEGIDGNGMITIGAAGVSELQLISEGTFAEEFSTRFETMSLSIRPVDRPAEVQTAQIGMVPSGVLGTTLDVVQSFFGGDPKTAAGHVANFAGGMLIVGDIGALVKNLWRGVTGGKVNKAEVILSSLGLLTEFAVGVGEAPDAAISAAKTIVATVGDGPFARVIAEVVKRSIKNGADLVNVARFLRQLVTSPQLLDVAKNSIRSVSDFFSEARIAQRLESICNSPCEVLLSSHTAAYKKLSAELGDVAISNVRSVLHSLNDEAANAFNEITLLAARGGDQAAAAQKLLDDAYLGIARAIDKGVKSGTVVRLLETATDSMRAISNSGQASQFPFLLEGGVRGEATLLSAVDISASLGKLADTNGVRKFADTMLNSFKNATRATNPNVGDAIGRLFELQTGAYFADLAASTGKRFEFNTSFKSSIFRKGVSGTTGDFDIIYDGIIYEVKAATNLGPTRLTAAQKLENLLKFPSQVRKLITEAAIRYPGHEVRFLSANVSLSRSLATETGLNAIDKIREIGIEIWEFDGVRHYSVLRGTSP